MIEPGSIHAIIPSRGNVDLSEIVGRLRAHREIGLVSIECSGTPFSRYLAAARSQLPIIYTQDDDCITDVEPLFASWDSWYWCNGFINAMTRDHAKQYPGAETLIGFGALFGRNVIRNSPMIDPLTWSRDDLFLRESDRVFGTIHMHRTVFPDIEIKPWASAADRFWKQPDHIAARDAMRARILEKTGIEHGGR